MQGEKRDREVPGPSGSLGPVLSIPAGKPNAHLCKLYNHGLDILSSAFGIKQVFKLSSFRLSDRIAEQDVQYTFSCLDFKC